MLEIIRVDSAQLKNKIFESFDPERHTWVVSDLCSKSDIQKKIKQKQSYYLDLSVLRASEVWQDLLKRSHPEFQVLSPAVCRAMMGYHLRSQVETKNLSPQINETIYSYIDQLMPVLSHPDGAVRAHEWLQEPQAASARQRWGLWLEWAQEYWNFFREQKILSMHWIPGFLLNELDFEKYWKRDLVVDLGFEFQRVEADLVRHISRYQNVKVLMPDMPEADQLPAYEFLKSQMQGKAQHLKSEPNLIETKKHYLKFTTELAEIKHCVALCREYLDQKKCEPQEILIVAPDIEHYWPALDLHSRVEGLPISKAKYIRLQNVPAVMQWLSYLRSSGAGLSSEDLESALYTNQDKTDLQYSAFKQKYTHIYEEADINRDEKASHRIRRESSDQVMTRNEFYEWAVARGDHFDRLDYLDLILSDFLKQCRASIQLPLQSWIDLLSQVMSRLEVKISEAQNPGVQFVNINSAEAHEPKVRFFLGLTEQNLRSSYKSQILVKDIWQINQSLGFHLNNPDESHLELELQWLEKNASAVDYFFYPATDFNGKIQAPSLFWLKGLSNMHLDFQRPQSTRLDEIQLSELPLDMKTQIDIDRGLLPQKNFGGQSLRLSASSLENYFKCPFIAASQKLFKLFSDEEVDFEVGPMKKGTLQHKICEILLQDRRDYSTEELRVLIQKAADEVHLQVADDRLKAIFLEKNLKFAQNFLQFESEWQAKFPQNRNLKFEAGFNFYIDPDTQEVHLNNAKPEFIQIAGKIDRIDGDGQHVVVIDYKSSQNDSIQNHASWLQNDRFQMAIYTLAVECGAVTDLQNQQVVAALYLILKDFKKDKGFMLTDENFGLYEVKPRSQAKLSEAEKRTLLKSSVKKIIVASNRIKMGEFTPQPRDMKDCVNCDWKNLCRAPHLN